MCFSGAVELRNTLGRTFGVDLPSTLAFDYPTAAAIADLIFPMCGTATTAVNTTTEQNTFTSGSTARMEVCLRDQVLLVRGKNVFLLAHAANSNCNTHLLYPFCSTHNSRMLIPTPRSQHQLS